MTQEILKPKPDKFRAALTRLATDDQYRVRAATNPTLVEKDFQLSFQELETLRQAAILSGADVTAVNKVRAKSLDENAATNMADFSISCCSCCCCCCGETTVLELPA
jgi:hypothetical protein